MRNYTSIIQSAIRSEKYHLSEKIKGDLDVIIKNTDKSWAPLKAVVASTVAKIVHPDWDTRKHQKQIGGKHSLRMIDKSYVCDYLFKNGYYDTATEFSLTRSFEKAEPYTQTYSGNICPKESKRAFLNSVEVINTDASDTLLNDILVYVMLFLKDRRAKNTLLKNAVGEVSNNLTLSDVSDTLDTMFTLGSGMSVIPVIVTHTLLSVILPHVFPGVSLKKLNEHTAPDNHTKSCGDIEGSNEQSDPVIAIEVKHNIKITESIIMTFDKKTNGVPLKFILTTAKTPKAFVKNNICVDTVSGFVVTHLQHCMMYEPDICSIFMRELRHTIVSYHNISIKSKEAITAILVQSSP